MSRLRRSCAVRLLLLVVSAPLLGQTLTHGQMVGEVTDQSALVWGRASSACFVSVAYSTHPALVGALETQPVVATAARDFTVRVPLAGLQPATRYHYRLRLAATPGLPGTLGPIGRFDTAAAANDPRPVSFAFSGDAQTLAEYDTFTAIAAQQPAFFVSLGDFPYCDGSTTMAAYWAMHQSRRNSSLLHAMTQTVPWLPIWDDHEVTNNWDAATDPALVPLGVQAFHDWFPMPDQLYDIFRQRRFGSGLELFLIDTRRYRGVNADLPAPGKPLLGPVQLQWLQQALQQSTATWKLVCTSVPTFYGGTDSWDGYVHERQQLLDFLRAQNLHDVVFLAADQHLAAVRELREGLLEVQAGPIAQFEGGGLHAREPEQRWHATVRNFAMVHVDPTVTPARLRVVFHDATGAVLHEVERRATGPAAATLQWRCDAPEVGFHLAQGPHLVRDEGLTAQRARLLPGNYRLLARDLLRGDTPATVDFAVPPGAAVRIGADQEDVPGANPLLFADSFDVPFGAAPGWTVADLSGTGGSSWLVVDGALSQRSNLGGGGAPNWFGTLATAGSANWTDVSFDTRFWSTDNDSVGVVFRHTDAGNYYRLRLDAERTAVQLASVRNGVVRLLGEVAGVAGYAPDHWHGIRVVATGTRLRVFVDGGLVFDVQDSDHPRGRVGLYCWANQFVSFDDVVVRADDVTALRRARLFATDFAGGVSGFSFVDQGTTSAPSAWSVVAGELVQTSNIGDNDGTRSGLPKLGTLAIAGPAVADQEVRVRLRSSDDDAFGVVFRYQDPQNYYRFSIDAERQYRRLTRCLQGQWAVLWEDVGDYLPDCWHELAVAAEGDRLRVTWNGLVLCEVHDQTLAAGRAGLYCWANTGARFDDFSIGVPASPRAVTVAVGSGSQDVLHLCAPRSAGQVYLLALSSARTPGIPLAGLQPNDPRTWELANDAFFQASLTPSPFLQQFLGLLDPAGRADGTILFPPGAAALLAGLPVFAGGIAWNPSTGRFGEVFPTVPVVVR